MTWARLGIRARITGGSLLIAALISVVAGILIYSQVQRIVSDGQVAVLKNVEAPYLTALELEPTETFDSPGASQMVAVVDPSGFPQVNTLPAALASTTTELTKSLGTRILSAGSTSYLVRVTAVTTPQGAWSVISASANDIQQSVLNQVGILLVASIAAINLAFGGASWLIGGAVLSPVTRLRRTAEKLVRSPTRELLPVGPTHDEIAELAETLNELIEHMRESNDRERQIVSDASHELRTPISILQTQLELAQAEASSLSQMKSDVTAAQATVARLAALAASMLELSRIEAQTSPGSATLEELSRELANAADRGRRHVGARDIHIEYDSALGAGESRVQISANDFGRLCSNLVDNALTAMGSNGTIVLGMIQHAGNVVLTVKDDAGGMDEAFLPFALNRFSQADSARAAGGSGLGLAIVSALVEVAGGNLTLINTVGTGLEVTVRLPANSEVSGLTLGTYAGTSRL
jgi:two-component system OmpR family sensor kinase